MPIKHPSARHIGERHIGYLGIRSVAAEGYAPAENKVSLAHVQREGRSPPLIKAVDSCMTSYMTGLQQSCSLNLIEKALDRLVQRASLTSYIGRDPLHGRGGMQCRLN